MERADAPRAPRAAGLNRWLDTLPRTRLGRFTREVPAFRTCGVLGFYAAVLAAMGGALVARLSLVVMVAVALVCALSFFGYVYGRRWLTGRETLELLDQVWFAELVTVGALLALGVPVLPYLDVLAVALCPFLAAGRVGCTLVGCCHGRPSSFGITYRAEHAGDGFPRHLVGIRLLPVPAFEAAGLVTIGGAGLGALPFAPAGSVFAWFLVSYAILRFGLEELRGDVRPHLLGLSKPQWMSVAEFGVGLWLAQRTALEPVAAAPLMVVAVLLPLTLAGALGARWWFDRRRRVLHPDHLAEAQRLLDTACRDHAAGTPPVARRSSAGLSIAVSDGSTSGSVHVSLARGPDADLPLLCDVAARVLPRGAVHDVVLAGGVLHIVLFPDTAAAPPRASALYRAAVLRLQAEAIELETAPGTSAAPVPSRRSYFGNGPAVEPAAVVRRAAAVASAAQEAG
jgi:prolipoprotein diacylglyceryltransferase